MRTGRISGWFSVGKSNTQAIRKYQKYLCLQGLIVNLFDKTRFPAENRRTAGQTIRVIFSGSTRPLQTPLGQIGAVRGGYCLIFFVLMLLLGTAMAQSVPAEKPQEPIDADSGFLASQGAQPRFQFASKLSDEAALALRQQRLETVPHFTGSFAFEGSTFPYTIVGGTPQAGGSTQIPTQLLPVGMLFEGFVDDKGEPIYLEPGTVIGRVRNSPNFRSASYQTGFTQFADGVQRAQFFHSMAPDWHTLLDSPQLVKPINILVPRGMAKVFRIPGTRTVYAVVDSAFFVSQLNTIVQMANLRSDALAIVLTRNIFLSPESELKRCCVLGFHTAFDAGVHDNKQMVQTLVWASWTDQGILGTNLGDITALSHEIGEWMNDPFGSNFVPAWQYPLASLGCQNTLETADPIAALPNSTFAVNIDAFTYHPQTQVLLPWFTRQPSDAVDGAYSFPDQHLLNSPSQACPNQ